MMGSRALGWLALSLLSAASNAFYIHVAPSVQTRIQATSVHHSMSTVKGYVNEKDGIEYISCPQIAEHPIFAEGEDQLPVVLYDGDCGFCAGAIWFIIDCDRKEGGNYSFRFCAQNSELGEEMLRLPGESFSEGLDSIVVMDKGRVYTGSSACVVIGQSMIAPFAMLAEFVRLFLPMPIREALYRLLSDKRHVFGETEGCRIPEEVRVRADVRELTCCNLLP
ncbi:unnamed protein product [Chrysoparadoxa australica]